MERDFVDLLTSAVLSRLEGAFTRRADVREPNWARPTGAQYAAELDDEEIERLAASILTGLRESGPPAPDLPLDQIAI